MTSPGEKQGYLGNLSYKSTAVLMDLLARQEKILCKKKFVDALPDQGTKVRAFADRLRQLLSERGPSTDGSSLQNSSAAVFQSGPVHIRQQQCPENVEMEEAKSNREIQKDPTEIEHGTVLESVQGDRIDTTEIKNIRTSDDQKTSDLHTDKECPTVNDDEVDVSLQKMHISEDTSVAERLRKEKATNAYSKAIQNASNVTSTSFKPNRTLKITTISELPSTYKCKSRMPGYIPPVTGTAKAVEVTAATPPIYKQDSIKIISIEESLTIQKLQKVRQEELMAKHAAEKLTQRLCVTMDTYNPEGVDMSYRNREADSDDDVD